MQEKEVWVCSDGLREEDFSKALTHEKSINVKARHRGELPQKLIQFITSDGKVFEGKEYGTHRYAAEHHEAELLNAQATSHSVEALTSLLWHQEMTREQFKEHVARNLSSISTLLPHYQLWAAGGHYFSPTMSAQG